MGERHRATARDLFMEERDHRPGGSEHIAEAHHGKARAGGACGKILDQQLGKSLGGAHDRGGADGLVCRNQNEAFHTNGPGGIRHAFRAEHVVLDALDGVVLNQWHMLVGGCVQDDVCLAAGHRVFDQGFVCDGPQNCMDFGVIRHAAQFAVNLEKGQLAVIQKCERGRLARNELSAQL